MDQLNNLYAVIDVLRAHKKLSAIGNNIFKSIANEYALKFSRLHEPCHGAPLSFKEYEEKVQEEDFATGPKHRASGDVLYASSVTLG
jgi:hypothetical protein